MSTATGVRARTWLISHHAIERYIQRFAPDLAFDEAAKVLRTEIRTAKPIVERTRRGDPRWTIDSLGVVAIVKEEPRGRTVTTIEPPQPDAPLVDDNDALVLAAHTLRIWLPDLLRAPKHVQEETIARAEAKRASKSARSEQVSATEPEPAPPEVKAKSANTPPSAKMIARRRAKFQAWLSDHVHVCVGCRLARAVKRDPASRSPQAMAGKLLQWFGTVEAAIANTDWLAGADQDLVEVQVHLQREDADWWARQDAALLREWRARDVSTTQRG